MWCETHFRLIEPLHWEVGRVGSGLVAIVPAGYLFDVSVPRHLRWLVSPADRRLLLAAAIHDWLLDDNWSANRAAIEFYHGLRAGGVGCFWAATMTTAVLIWTA